MSQALLRSRRNSGNSRGLGKPSTRLRGSKFESGPKIGPFVRKTEAAQELAEVLADIPVGDIAIAAGVSKETAKNWKRGERMPNGDATLDLGANLERVGDYIMWRIGRAGDQHDSIEASHAHAEIEMRLASLPPDQAAAVRARLGKRG